MEDANLVVVTVRHYQANTLANLRAKQPRHDLEEEKVENGPLLVGNETAHGGKGHVVRIHGRNCEQITLQSIRSMGNIHRDHLREHGNVAHLLIGGPSRNEKDLAIARIAVVRHHLPANMVLQIAMLLCFGFQQNFLSCGLAPLWLGDHMKRGIVVVDHDERDVVALLLKVCEQLFRCRHRVGNGGIVREQNLFEFFFGPFRHAARDGTRIDEKSGLVGEKPCRSRVIDSGSDAIVCDLLEMNAKSILWELDQVGLSVTMAAVAGGVDA